MGGLVGAFYGGDACDGADFCADLPDTRVGGGIAAGGGRSADGRRGDAGFVRGRAAGRVSLSRIRWGTAMPPLRTGFSSMAGKKCRRAIMWR